MGHIDAHAQPGDFAPAVKKPRLRWAPGNRPSALKVPAIGDTQIKAREELRFCSSDTNILHKMRFIPELLMAILAATVPPLAASSSVRRDFAALQADVTSLHTQVFALNHTLYAFPTNLASLHSASTTLLGTLNTAVADATAAGALNSDDTFAVLIGINNVEGAAIDGLLEMGHKRAAFKATVPCARALLLQDLEALHTASNALNQVLLETSFETLVLNFKDMIYYEHYFQNATRIFGA
ncbi:hypothetical protein FB451DRAFT_1412358 [Mycena latifolia]|nr:hypothetical protein FB451DRAFT_1412358 [Mycena latifolia]